MDSTQSTFLFNNIVAFVKYTIFSINGYFVLIFYAIWDKDKIHLSYKRKHHIYIVTIYISA